ncbi:hypothetical protein ACEXQD_08245 [Herbiconiux sp. P15]|uniref:hypothetical protein n=1 Tax=Herbiconiux liukaitaii TaxID=3342799 RepID=UPI0035B6AEF3
MPSSPPAAPSARDSRAGRGTSAPGRLGRAGRDRRAGGAGAVWRLAAVLAGLVAIGVAVSGCVAGTPGESGTTSSAAAPSAVVSTAAPEIAPGPAAELQLPEVGAGAVGIASADGTVEMLGQGGETGTVPIASITKVITSLVVLSAHPLAGPDDQGPTLTLGQADLDTTATI